jgi:hypothetical protein
MQTILALQKLDVPEPDFKFGNSCTSSLSMCCYGNTGDTVDSSIVAAMGS